jgi:hypothetical protein
MYKVDVTGFRQIESEEGFPIPIDEETKAWELFYKAVADLYSDQSRQGPYTVILYAVGTGGEVPLRTELVNVPRK